MKSKRILLLFIAIMNLCMFYTMNVSAATISFTITTYGSGADTKSKREIKTADGDNNAYFRVSEYVEGNAPVWVCSLNLNNPDLIYTGTARLSPEVLNVRQTRSYNVTAPGGQYYYMSAGNNPLYARTSIKGFYCP